MRKDGKEKGPGIEKCIGIFYSDADKTVKRFGRSQNYDLPYSDSICKTRGVHGCESYHSTHSMIQQAKEDILICGC